MRAVPPRLRALVETHPNWELKPTVKQETEVAAQAAWADVVNGRSTRYDSVRRVAR